jgi:hypothetical protein
MTGRSDDDIAADIAQARSLLEQRRYPMKIITPLELAQVLNEFVDRCTVHESPLPYGMYLAADVAHIINLCDAVCFCRGWQQSRGCRLEMAAAKIFEKTCIYPSKNS